MPQRSETSRVTSTEREQAQHCPWRHTTGCLEKGPFAPVSGADSQCRYAEKKRAAPMKAQGGAGAGFRQRCFAVA